MVAAPNAEPSEPASEILVDYVNRYAGKLII